MLEDTLQTKAYFQILRKKPTHRRISIHTQTNRERERERERERNRQTDRGDYKLKEGGGNLSKSL